MTKFTVDSFSNKLGQVLQMNNSVFIADNKRDQKVYNLILSFTHFFNNLRDILIISQLINSELQKIEKTNNPKYGQFGGMQIFVDNLFFAFILEFMQLLKNNKNIIQNDSFTKIIKITNKKTQEDWEKLSAIVYESNNKVYKVLLKLRNNLSFHYYQPLKLFEGYCTAVKNPNSKMYFSLGETMSETRYYFYDLSNQLSIYNIIKEEGFTLTEWIKEKDNLVNFILSVTMNIVNKFISKSAPSVAKIEKIQHIKEFLK